MLRTDTHKLLDITHLVLDAVAIDDCRSRCWLKQPRQHIYYGRLPGAILAEEACF